LEEGQTLALRGGRSGATAIALLTVMAVALPGWAGAAPPDFVLQAPETQVAPGSGAGELDNPRGVAVRADTGHLYVADLNNNRVSEYTAWGLFVRSWGWGVADGSVELQSCGPPMPEEDPDPSLCREGIAGAGKGQLNSPFGMAVDPAGNVYVFELGNLRVQKFSPTGKFLVMFGGDVNKTKVEEGAPEAQRNVCPITPTDVCQAGVSGEGPSQLTGSIRDHIAYSPVADAILVGDKDAIQVFDLDGGYREEIAFEGELAAFAGFSVSSLATDEDGNIYLSLSGVEDVFKLSPAGVPLAPGKPGESKFEVGNPLGVAVDVDGSVYAIDDPPAILSDSEARVLQFDAAGNRTVPTKAETDAGEFFPYISYQGPSINGLTTNLCEGSEEPGSLYITLFAASKASYVNGYGTPPIGCEPPPPRPPEIRAQFASAVGREEATVKAQINPLFWSDTTYYVEYGTGKCSEGGCPAKAPVSPAPLTGKSANASLTTAGVVLEGLEAGTTYHYRFVAQSGGGGPVFGVDPDGRGGPAQANPEEGLEATFRTFQPAAEPSVCPSDGVRLGPSEKLPDCRAYEMVSPLDKEGGDVALWRGGHASFPHFLELHQSAPSGNRFTYSSLFAFADPKGAPYISQYLAERGSDGWASEPLSPPRAESPVVDVTSLFDNEFRGFSEDLCTAWVQPYSVATLAEGAVEKYLNLYRRQNCADPPSYETLTLVKPSNRAASEYVVREVAGFSDDGTHTVFAANGKLHADAPALKASEPLLYEHTNDELRFVCYLPSGKASPSPCAAGTAAGSISNRHNAVSADGSRIFWTAYSGTLGFTGIPGQIYVRIDGAETRKVSTTKSSDPAWYWTAAEDGSKAIFAFDSGALKDELYELDVATETATLIAKEVEGPMGASEDASRIYFASKEDLDEGGPASADDHNLYLYEAGPGGGEGDFTFIMELTAEDVGGDIDFPAPIDEVQLRSARVSPDGLHATFTSVASPTPTGYDNLDASSGEPTQQVYLYDAVEDELRCVSCNPTGARPAGENIGTEVRPFWVASRVQAWEVLFHAPRVLSEDGSRVFFESHEALVPRDTNGTWDVYQWEKPGKGSCEEGSETFSDASGGCVELISSGLSPTKSTFLDADPFGDSIFFSTQSSLVEADYGLNDVYVARVGGGFPEPNGHEECEGEACQSPPPPPPEVTPSSELVQGAGNVTPVGPRRCPKGKRRVKRAGKARCVPRKARAKARRRARR